jgi:hypothetical protein
MSFNFMSIYLHFRIIGLIFILGVTTQLQAQITNGTINYELRADAFYQSYDNDGLSSDDNQVRVALRSDTYTGGTAAWPCSGMDLTCSATSCGYYWNADAPSNSNNTNINALLYNCTGRTGTATSFRIEFETWEEDGSWDCSGSGDAGRWYGYYDVVFRNATKTPNRWWAPGNLPDVSNFVQGPEAWTVESGTRYGDAKIKTVWRYTNGFNCANPLTFGTIAPGTTYKHINSNRGAPAGASADKGYTNTLGNASPEVYYSFTLSNTSTVVISTISAYTNFDTYLRLYNTGCGTQLAFNDDFGGSVQSQITADLCPGTYVIMVEGFSANAGDFELSVLANTLTPNGGVIGGIGNNSAYCYLADPGAFTNVTSPNRIGTYEWQRSTSSDFSTGVTNLGVNALTYDPPAGLTNGTYYFRRRVTDECGNVGYSNVISVIIRPPYSAGTIGSTAQTICYNTQPSNITFTTAPSGGTTPTYQWYYQEGDVAAPSGIFDGAGWTAIGSASTSTPTLAGTAMGNLTGPRTYALRVYDGGITNCYNNWQGSRHVVTVRPAPTASISGTVTVCAGAGSQTITFTNPEPLAVTVTYKVNGGADQTVNIGASTTATILQSAASAGIFTYTLQSVRYQSAPDCNNAISGSATVTVRQLAPSASVTLAQCADLSNPYAELTATAPGAGIAGIWTKPNPAHAGTITDPANASTVITGLSNTGAATQVQWTLYHTSAPACSTSLAVPLTITPPSMANLTAVSLQNDGAATSTGTPAQTRYMCRTCSVRNGNTYTYFDATGRIIATIVDKTTNGADLGNTEVCIGYDYSPPTAPTSANVKTIIDNRGYTQPYLPRSWTIKPAAGSDATVTLYFTSDELAALQTRAATTQYNFSGLDLAVTKYPGGNGGGQFIAPKSAGGVFTPSTFGSFTGGYQVTFDVNSFSTFYVHPQTFPFAALPVELISFAGYHESVRNTLIWKTASERNADRFEVEKSDDGSQWQYIGMTKATGNTNGQSEYTFHDNNPVMGNNYYRLRIVDNDASYEYSNIINIKVGETEVNGIASVYPNPTDNEVTVVIQTTNAQNAVVSISNVLGQEVMSVPVSLVSGVNKVQLQTSGLPAGTYVIAYADQNAKRYTEKLIKK